MILARHYRSIPRGSATLLYERPKFREQSELEIGSAVEAEASSEYYPVGLPACAEHADRPRGHIFLSIS